MGENKEEKTKVEMSDAEDYLRASLRAVERLQRRPKYANPRSMEEWGIRSCLGWMRGSLMIALNLREYERKEPEKEGTTAEEDLRATVQAIDAIMQKPEYANAKLGTEEHGFRECLKWMRAIFEIAIELIEAEKEGHELVEREKEIEKYEGVHVNATPIYKCLKCGRVWEISLTDIPETEKTKCPYCGGKGFQIGGFNPNEVGWKPEKYIQMRENRG